MFRLGGDEMNTTGVDNSDAFFKESVTDDNEGMVKYAVVTKDYSKKDNSQPRLCFCTACGDCEKPKPSSKLDK